MKIVRSAATILFAVVFIAGIACNAFSQDVTSGATKLKGKPGMPKNPGGKATELTKEQKDKIDQLHMAFAKSLVSLKNQIAEKRAHLKTISMVDQPDTVAINKTIDELYTLRAEVAKKKSSEIQGIRKILTPEQRMHFDMKHNKRDKGRFDDRGSGRPFMGKWPHGMGPGNRHMGPGCMNSDPVYDKPGENNSNNKDTRPSEEKK